MDKKTAKYDQVLTQLLDSYAADMNRSGMGIAAKPVLDRERGHYQLLNSGWRNGKYYFYVVFHFEL
ncbi:MAG: element excision factor XisI family protein, partial [Saprospiraceae bacterium]